MDNFKITEGNSPIIVTAIHDGHQIREELLPYLNLAEHERMREEDPYTAYLTPISSTRVVVNTSRFEVDLNRPRAKAIYQTPEDAWGLQVWKSKLPDDVLAHSLEIYDKFYAQFENLLQSVIHQFGYFIVLDLHSYNYRRKSPHEMEPRNLNPEINLGTQFIDPEWRHAVDAFTESLLLQKIRGHQPDVRENVKFKGGAFSQWINRHYGRQGCAIAIEFKKTFMDEWTGRLDVEHLDDIKEAIASALPELKQVRELMLQ